jgi:hypothetical protein
MTNTTDHVYEELDGFLRRGKEIGPPFFPDNCPTCCAPAVSVSVESELSAHAKYACGGEYKRLKQIQNHTRTWWGVCGAVQQPKAEEPAWCVGDVMPPQGTTRRRVVRCGFRTIAIVAGDTDKEAKERAMLVASAPRLAAALEKLIFYSYGQRASEMDIEKADPRSLREALEILKEAGRI